MVLKLWMIFKVFSWTKVSCESGIVCCVTLLRPIMLDLCTKVVLLSSSATFHFRSCLLFFVSSFR